MPAFLDLTNQRFGRLVAIRRTRVIVKGQRQHTMWRCKCVCGRMADIFAENLKRGRTKSCGCYRDEWQRNAIRIHGCARSNARTREYRAWSNAKERCFNPTTRNFKYWAGRGITVCDEWINDFARFLRDMGPCPDGYMLERMDGNGNYTPDNCKWATPSEQMRNKRDNINITIGGETLCVAAWAERMQIRSQIIYKRLKRGWEPEDAVTTPQMRF